MSDEVVIAVEGLASCPLGDTARRGKRYRLGAGRSNERYTALRDVLADKAKSLFRARHSNNDFWALRDINFEVRRRDGCPAADLS